MLRVCIYLEDSNSENQWSYLLSHFQSDEIYLQGDYSTTDKIFKNVKRGIPDTDLILMAPKNGRYIQGEISLGDFKHPIDATYVFGSDKSYMCDMEGTKVYIPTDTKHDMYSWVAGAITLWDRRYG